MTIVEMTRSKPTRPGTYWWQSEDKRYPSEAVRIIDENGQLTVSTADTYAPLTAWTYTGWWSVDDYMMHIPEGDLIA